MYNFKAIDYKLSKQEYLFSLLNSIDKTDYDFVYVPYSEFPALLMLDYALATNPHEFNADLFEFFRGAEDVEKQGSKDILILSEDLSNREGYANKLGIFTEDYHIGQIQKQISSSRKQIVFKGVSLNTAIGNKEIMPASLVQGFSGLDEGRITSEIILDIFKRDDSILSELMKSNYLGYNKREFEGELASIRTATKDLISVELVSSIKVERENFNCGVVKGLKSFSSGERKGKYHVILNMVREDICDSVLLEDAFTKTLNSLEGIIINSNFYTKDYLVFNLETTADMYRQVNLKGSIDDFTLGERYSYVKGDNTFSLESFHRVNKLGAYFSSISFFDKYQDGNLIKFLNSNRNSFWYIHFNTLVLSNKEDCFEWIEDIDANREGGGKGHSHDSIIFNKKLGYEIILENSLASEGDTEKIFKMTNVYSGETKLSREVELVDYSLFVTPSDRFAITLVDSDATKYVEGRTVKESFLDGIKEGIGSEIIYYSIDSKREIDYKGIINIDTAVDYEKDGLEDTTLVISGKAWWDGFKDSYYISGVNATERNTVLEKLDTEIRPDDRYSILMEGSISDKEKDAKLWFSFDTDKEKSTIVNNLSCYIRGYEPLGHLIYDTDCTIERWEKGVLGYNLFSIRGTTSKVIVDLHGIYSDYSIDKQAFIMAENSIGYREMNSRGVVKGILFNGEEIARYGKQEFLEYAFKPRKKLIISWLDGFERDAKRDMFLEFPLQGGRDLVKNLEKYILNRYRRGIKKDLSIGYDLIAGDVKRTNRLDREVHQFDGFKPITKQLESNAALAHGVRYKIKPLLKFNLDDYDFEKDAVIEYNKYFDKFKDAFIEKQVNGQSLMYDYSNILEEGIEVEHWKVGYAIPEHYDPLDPFNSYYPWAEERNTHSIIQEEEWEQTQGEWSLDKGNAVINVNEGGGILTTKTSYKDFKFRFNVYVGYNSESRAGFIFKYVDISNYYKVTLSSGNEPISLIQMIDGRERRITSPIAPFYMDGGSWHRIDVSCVENKLVVHVDGRLQYDLVLED